MRAEEHKEKALEGKTIKKVDMGGSYVYSTFTDGTEAEFTADTVYEPYDDTPHQEIDIRLM